MFTQVRSDCLVRKRNALSKRVPAGLGGATLSKHLYPGTLGKEITLAIVPGRACTGVGLWREAGSAPAVAKTGAPDNEAAV